MADGTPSSSIIPGITRHDARTGFEDISLAPLISRESASFWSDNLWFSGVATLVLATALLLWFKRSRRRKKLVPPQPSTPPRDKALLALQQLRTRLEDKTYTARDGAAELSRIIRHYLEERWHRASVARTVNEILELNSFSISPELTLILEQLLASTKNATFAAEGADLNSELIEKAEAYIKKAEELATASAENKQPPDDQSDVPV